MKLDEDTCATIFRMLDDYVDRELSDDDIIRVERHLVSCAVCASEFRFEDQVLVQVRSKVQRIAAPPDLHARVWKNIVTRARRREPSGRRGHSRDDSGKSG